MGGVLAVAEVVFALPCLRFALFSIHPGCGGVVGRFVFVRGFGGGCFVCSVGVVPCLRFVLCLAVSLRVEVLFWGLPFRSGAS